MSCQGGDDSLNNILGFGNYQCPINQEVVISNNNNSANFTVQPCGGIQVQTPSTLPGGQFGVYYSTQLSASSCSGNLNWSLNSGTLPPGLTLFSGGPLNGTPTNSGTFNFNLHATDGTASTNQNFSLTISSPIPPTLGHAIKIRRAIPIPGERFHGTQLHHPGVHEPEVDELDFHPCDESDGEHVLLFRSECDQSLAVLPHLAGAIAGTKHLGLGSAPASAQ